MLAICANIIYIIQLELPLPFTATAHLVKDPDN